MNLEELAIRSGFSICKVTGAWSGGVSCRRELEKFAELVRKPLQAKIDELMFEWCPDEMTREQVDEWARHQRPRRGSVLKEQP